MINHILQLKQLSLGRSSWSRWLASELELWNQIFSVLYSDFGGVFFLFFFLLLFSLAFCHLEKGEHLHSTKIYTWHAFVKYLSHSCMNKWMKISTQLLHTSSKLPANSTPERCDANRQNRFWFGKEWMTWVHSFVHSLISSLHRHRWGFTMSQVLLAHGSLG